MPISPLTRSVRLDGPTPDSNTLDLLDRLSTWPQSSESSLSDTTDKRVDGDAKQDDEVRDDSPDAEVDVKLAVAQQTVILPLTLRLASNVAAEASVPELTAASTTPHNSVLSSAVLAQPLVNNEGGQRKASLAAAGAAVTQAALVSGKLAAAPASASASASASAPPPKAAAAAPGRLDRGEPLLTRDRNAADPVARHLNALQLSETAAMVGEDAAPPQDVAVQAEGSASAEPEAGKAAHPHTPLPHEESIGGKKAETSPSLPQRLTSLFSAAKPIPNIQPALVAAPQTEIVYSFQSWGQGHQVTAQISAAGALLIPSSPKVESALQLANAGIPSDERWTLAEQGEQQERERHSGRMNEQEEEHD